MTRYRVIISGASELWCKSLMLAFNENPSFEIAYINVEQAIQACIEKQPDVLLFKFEDQKQLDEIIVSQEQYPFTLLVIVIEDPNTVDLTALLNSGVRGCLPNRLFPQQIVNAVELIAAAGIACVPRMGQVSYATLSSSRELVKRLTNRELEILHLLCRSYSNQEMASSLCISEATVKTHLHNIFKKFKVHSRSQVLSLLMQKDSAGH